MLSFPCPRVRGSLKARFSTLPSIPGRRKIPILSAQNSIAARNESHTPITRRWERDVSSIGESSPSIEKVKTRLLLSKITRARSRLQISASVAKNRGLRLQPFHRSQKKTIATHHGQRWQSRSIRKTKLS